MFIHFKVEGLYGWDCKGDPGVEMVFGRVRSEASICESGCLRCRILCQVWFGGLHDQVTRIWQRWRIL
jgi:hypothetical protein